MVTVNKTKQKTWEGFRSARGRTVSVQRFTDVFPDHSARRLDPFGTSARGTGAAAQADPAAGEKGFRGIRGFEAAFKLWADGPSAIQPVLTFGEAFVALRIGMESGAIAPICRPLRASRRSRGPTQRPTHLHRPTTGERRRGPPASCGSIMGPGGLSKTPVETVPGGGYSTLLPEESAKASLSRRPFGGPVEARARWGCYSENAPMLPIGSPGTPPLA